ncbi:hypothetical protein [Blastococcus sp. LR1]|uniref:hypothetical protein n=1 Tax=Blastococcus sp. LR1 TaxID=2877000 RepID=UPI001CCAE872|nr:hypothetical protein [Blastococcus sp. LR1]MCA0143987.1 hypothetical protein [Blastococcus sp. LR1]
MGLYRLVDDKDSELFAFEADDEAKAARKARDWMRGRTGVAAVFTLQRGDVGAWAGIRTWVPRPQKPVWQEPNAWSDGRVAKKSGAAPPSTEAL